MISDSWIIWPGANSPVVAQTKTDRLASFEIRLAAVNAIINKAKPIASLEFLKRSNFEIFISSFYQHQHRIKIIRKDDLADNLVIKDLAMTTIQPISTRESVRKSKLYLVPTPDKEFGDEWYHPKFSPIPSALSELPEVDKWSENFVIKVLEVWSGRRSLAQLSRNCHRSAQRQIAAHINFATQKCQIRKIYLNQPIEGVVEVTATLRVVDRVRSLTFRLESIDI